MSKPRDSQRSRCYSAERAAVARHPGLRFDVLVRVRQYVDDVLGSKWWTDHVAYLGPVEVRESDRGRKAHAGPMVPSRRGREIVYRLTPNVCLPSKPAGAWAWNDWVVLHELAHIGRMNDRGWFRSTEASHGPEWAGLFLGLVGEFMGEEAAGVLAEEFAKHRVRYTPALPVQIDLPDFRAAARAP